jgi:Anti-sigma-K factor rskA
VYEVWVERDGALEPSSLFVPRRDGSAEAAVSASLDGAEAVLVTREPRGGSRQPTSRPLLRADLH